jgi:putative ABC transport system permease protein
MIFTHSHIKTAAQSLRGAKWRNFWTMLGVIIGVASVISAVSIGEGIKLQVGGQISHLGKNLITIRPARIHSGTGSSNLSLLAGNSISGSLSGDDLGRVAKVSGVGMAVPLSANAGGVTGEHGAYTDGLVIGTTPDFANLTNQTIDYGSFLTDDDMGLYTAVLGRHAADTMFDEGIPLGRTFSYKGKDFIVRGILSDAKTAPISQDADFNNAIFIPYDVSGELTNNSAPTYEILVKPAQAKAIDATISRITSVLVRAHGGAHDVSVLRQDQTLANSSQILDLLTGLITGVAAISLLVGGLGIMNVMLVSVTERLHEIGIRKAIGATNRQILGQFMVEAVFLSLGGGIIGVGVAYAIDGLLRVFTNIIPSIPWQIVVIAVGVSLVTGVIFGTIPALKAARKDPIEALRSQ